MANADGGEWLGRLIRSMRRLPATAYRDFFPLWLARARRGDVFPAVLRAVAAPFALRVRLARVVFFLERRPVAVGRAFMETALGTADRFSVKPWAAWVSVPAA